MSTVLTPPAAGSRIDDVERIMLLPTDVGLSELEQAMGGILSRQVDFADLYCQLTRYETWTVEDGIVREGVFSIDQGVGVRAISGEKTGFAYADQLDRQSLSDAMRAARSIARAGGEGRYRIGSGLPVAPLYPGIDPLPTQSDEDKVALDGLNYTDLDSKGASVRLTWDLGSYKLHSITGYESVEIYSRSDIDGGNGFDNEFLGTLERNVRVHLAERLEAVIPNVGEHEKGVDEFRTG